MGDTRRVRWIRFTFSCVKTIRSRVQKSGKSFSRTRTSGTIGFLSLSHHEEHLEDEVAKLNRDLMLALESVSAYVERVTAHDDSCSFVGTHRLGGSHQNRSQDIHVLSNMEKTWILCAGIFCACLSRRSTHPVLLVRSELDAPNGSLLWRV